MLRVAGTRATPRVAGERAMSRVAGAWAAPRVVGERAALSCKGVTGSQFRLYSGFTVPP
jgi:hypothetical protein